MIKKSIFFILCFLLCTVYGSVEYLYPVGTIVHDDVEKICVIQQKDMKLQVWFWDPVTKKAYKGLSSIYSPAGLRVLPSRTSFSFIQNDAIRIKDVSKRSAATLDIYGPHDLSTLEWIDDDTFYFSARERGRMNLFQANRFGELLRLTVATDSDFLYPQKIGSELFYIEQCADGTSKIVKSPYTVPLMDEEEVAPYDAVLKNNERDVLYLHTDKTSEMAFLTLNSDSEGFFATFPSIVGGANSCVIFKMYRLYKSAYNQWNTAYLFSFSLPLHLILFLKNQPDRLYESIYPLLPRYINGALWYVSGDSDLALYQFLIDQQKSIQIVSDKGSLNFSPYRYQDKVYYGICVGTDDVSGIYQDEDEYYMNLPFLDL